MIKIKPHLQYFWWKYLLVLAGIIFLWSAVFSSLAKPDDNEQIIISHFGADYDALAMNSELFEKMSEITEQPLKEVSFVTVSSNVDDSMLGQLVQTRVYTSDIMIFEEGFFTDDLIKYGYKPITQDVINSYFTDNISDFEFYYIDEKPFGICLNPLSGKNNFSKNYKGSKKCVAFFSPESVNLAAMYEKGNVSDDAALCAMKYLLEVA